MAEEPTAPERPPMRIAEDAEVFASSGERILTTPWHTGVSTSAMAVGWRHADKGRPETTELIIIFPDRSELRISGPAILEARVIPIAVAETDPTDTGDLRGSLARQLTRMHRMLIALEQTTDRL